MFYINSSLYSKVSSSHEKIALVARRAVRVSDFRVQSYKKNLKEPNFFCIYLSKRCNHFRTRKSKCHKNTPLPFFLISTPLKSLQYFHHEIIRPQIREYSITRNPLIISNTISFLLKSQQKPAHFSPQSSPNHLVIKPLLQCNQALITL